MNRDALATWKRTPTRKAIEDFVASVTDQRQPTFVPPEERIAVFDNDGTLWCENPLPVQLDFLLRRAMDMAQEDPSLRNRQPWKAIEAKDWDWLRGAFVKHYHGDDGDLMEMAGGLLMAYEGRSVEEFADAASAFMHDARHPSLNRPYTACAYQPMIDLLRYLEANGFSCYIVSGGGRDFMRAISEEVFGIPLDRVIGSSVALEYRDDSDVAEIIHTAKIEMVDDGPEKPIRVWSRTGRRPILAGGNANGDIPMLRFVAHPSRPSLGLAIHHDDGEREFSYDAGAEQLFDEVVARGWTVVSMKNDWQIIFSGEQPAADSELHAIPPQDMRDTSETHVTSDLS